MLRLRLLTALILAPLAIWGILALPPTGFALVLGIIFSLAAWEWAGLAGLRFKATRIAFAVIVAWLMLTLYYPLTHHAILRLALPGLGLLWWTLALYLVVVYPRRSGLWLGHPLGILVAGLLTLVPAWAAVVVLHQAVGPYFVLILMLLVWGADSGAYFAGHRWGRHKLAPQVSPGKTREGLWGGLAVGVVIAGVAAPLLGLPVAQWPLFVAACVAAVLISVLGDLVESMFKRLSGVKDSSGLLPGHGGLMDRIDSLTAAGPLFALALLGMGVAA